MPDRVNLPANRSSAPLGASAQGNSGAAAVCEEGGYLNYTDTDSNAFDNTGQCVSYAAQGGVLVELRCAVPIPPADGSIVVQPLDLSGCDLSGRDLSGRYLVRANLSGADLSGADLTGTTLFEANLSGANLETADIDDAHLVGADLSGADLPGAYLVGQDLSGTNLSFANLQGANLLGANFTNANLLGADLTRAYVTDAIWNNTTCPSGVNSDANDGTCANSVGGI